MDRVTLRNNLHLASMLDNPRKERDAMWMHGFYFEAPQTSYVEIPDHGFTNSLFRVICPTDYPSSPLAKTFKQCVQEAHAYSEGLLIVRDPENDDAGYELLSYGAIWSFEKYGMLAGCQKTVYDFEAAMDIGVEEPIKATHGDGRRAIRQELDENIFPAGLRGMVRERIEKIDRSAIVTFYQVEEQDKYMPLSIVVGVRNLSPNISWPDIEQAVEWCMPPYHRVHVVSHQSRDFIERYFDRVIANKSPAP